MVSESAYDLRVESAIEYVDESLSGSPTEMEADSPSEIADELPSED
jgi:hypothetical protein